MEVFLDERMYRKGHEGHQPDESSSAPPKREKTESLPKSTLRPSDRVVPKGTALHAECVQYVSGTKLS
jgi:hypothetical protein